MSEPQSIRRGDSGPHVVQLQVALEKLGHDLPRFGVDGHAGSETFAAAAEWLFAAGHLHRGEGDEAFADVIVSSLVAEILEDAADPEGWPEWLHDFRSIHRGRQRGKRAWTKVTGITLHQTATCFLTDLSPSPPQLRRALQRVAKIRAHAVVLRCGQVALNAPLNRVMAHAHAFNAGDVGIEVDGWFAGVEGDHKTFWKPKSRPNRTPMPSSPAQVEAARNLVRWICERVAEHGGEVRYIHAHRQTHRGKPSDPGELIWQDVALWAINELGLDDQGPGFHVPHHRHRQSGGLSSSAGPGRPIPTEWDPSKPHTYRWRPDR